MNIQRDYRNVEEVEKNTNYLCILKEHFFIEKSADSAEVGYGDSAEKGYGDSAEKGYRNSANKGYEA